jgi:plasmid stabilization system protein ParE
VAWRVGWTEAALEDLSATAEYIARDSPRYASTFTRNAFAASDTLTEFAHSAREVTLLSPPTRTRSKPSNQRART